MNASLTGAEFKKQLRDGAPKMGLFLNSHSPTVANSSPTAATTGCSWTHNTGPWATKACRQCWRGIANGGAKSMVRVAGYTDRAGIQQSLDMGADGVLVPYINTAEEARAGRQLLPLSHRRHAVGVFPAAQHEQRRPARLCRRGKRQRDRRAAGGDRLLHPEHRGDRGRSRRRHVVPRTERSLHVDGTLREVRVPAHVHVAGARRGDAAN